MRSAVLTLLGRASTGSRSAWLGLVLTRLAQMLAVVAILLLAAFGWLALSLPVAGPAEPPRPSLLLESTDGRAFATRGAFRGAPVDLADLPPHLTDAVLAIEDRRFRSHLGVDLRGIGRALVANLAAGGVREGGSTITQQLARLLYLSQDRTLRRKLQEAMLAVWLELRLDKDAILERYLNEVYLGAGAWGVQGAAWRYFRKPARELSLSEAAMLAGLIQAPSDYAPTRDLATAQERASVVLGAMVDAGVFAEETAAAARASPAVPVVEPEAVPGRAYFADWVAGEAARSWARLGRLCRRTTLDLELQALAERVDRPAPGSRRRPRSRSSQAALVALACRWCRAGHGRRQRLPGEPVQPGHPGTTPAGLAVQALRLPGRLRGRAHARQRAGGRAGPGRRLAAGEPRRPPHRAGRAAHGLRPLAQQHRREAHPAGRAASA